DWRLLVLRAASLEVPETLSLLPDMQTVRLELRASKTAVRWWQALLACAAHAPMAETCWKISPPLPELPKCRHRTGGARCFGWPPWPPRRACCRMPGCC
ncbi:unnamed protein product, partial [Effrenium voratum]